MKNSQKLLFSGLFILIIGLSGCASASKQFARRLRGTWNVVNYSVQHPDIKSSSGISEFGTITFNKNGTGNVDNPSIFDNLTSAYRQQGGYRFRWSNSENTVVLQAEGAYAPKSWIVMMNKKSQQIWKSTDGANAVQTLELKR